MWSISSISLSLLVFSLVDLTSCLTTHQSHRNMFEMKPSLESFLRSRRTYIDQNENCGSDEMEIVHTIMDRICMLCHELQSHIAPNTRLECRQDCFRNTVFQSCMRIFSGKPPQPQRHLTEPTAPVPYNTAEVQVLEDINE